MASTNISTVAPPPPGVTPNPHNTHAHLKSANLILATVGITACTVALAVRIYTKAHLLHRFWLDDVSIILAWVFSMATQGVIIWGFYHAGYGLHIWDFTVPMLTTYMKTIVSASILYVPSLALAKIALLLLYHSVISPTTSTKTPIYLFYALGGIIVSYSLALILAIIFGCDPLARGWDASITYGSCINRNAVYLATAVTNTVSDVALLGVAVWIVRGLRSGMGLWAKIGVVCLFGIGGVTTAMSIIRLATLMPQVTSDDPPYKIAEASVFIIIEGNLIILCASLPYLRHFLRHHTPRFLGDPFAIRSLIRWTKQEIASHSWHSTDNHAEPTTTDVLSTPSVAILRDAAVDRV
ncbi:hypothetical protein BJX63DRAFT_414771 [Aspergillus granulosus]|uniref:Rhodopsin domain-containing protein n=1 Tax=Aspergillus granulosus TaxID=176169 RepID=A0ABR4GU26_9EURO